MLTNIRIMWPLLVRDWKVMASGLKDDCINGLLILVFAYVNFALFGSRFGIDQQFAAQAVIGVIVTMCISLGFGRTLSDLVDRDETKFLNYKKTLMITTPWLLVTLVMSYAIHFGSVALPAIVTSLILFSRMIVLSYVDIALFFMVFLGGVFFFSSIFVNMVCMISFSWFRLNIWQRVLTPMALTGCVLYPWSRLYAFSPFLGRCALGNPLTYFAEGMRIALGISPDSFPLWFAIIMIWIWFGISMLVLLTIGKKRFEHA